MDVSRPDSPETLSKRLDVFLRGLHTRPRKRLGQNFMIDSAALDFIRDAVLGLPAQAILEIGPGAGFLTERLAESALPLVAVDTDRRFCEALTDRFAKRPGMRVVHSDILRWDPAGILPQSTAVAGNIPYNITSPILAWLMERRGLWSGVILTVQREFAERLIAPAGTRACGPISVWLQLHAKIQILRRIGRGSFSPPPKVDSAVIRMDFYAEPLFAPDTAPVLERVMRSAFQARRKQIIHAVRTLVQTREAAERVLRGCGIGEAQRPETLTLQNWIDLAGELHRAKVRTS